MDAQTIIQIAGLVLGSGVLVILLRLVFTLGQYSQKVVHLENSLTEMGNGLRGSLKDLRDEIRDLRQHPQHHQQHLRTGQ